MPYARRRRRLGDRYDGRRLRTLNAFYQITPYIMRERSDAHDYYEDRVDISRTEAWLRELRNRGRPDIGYLQVFMAAMVRTISQWPRINRFVAGRRIFARDKIVLTVAIKKQLHEDGTETTVKIEFNPEDTVFDVSDRINAAIGLNKLDATKNQTDNTAFLFMLFPRFLIRFLIWLMRTLDFYGLMPKAVHGASPFHSTAFITNMGSLGIQPIYHHIYDFGTVSVFVAIGGKEKEYRLNSDGEVEEFRFIPIKVVNDERICDGYYYAKAFKYLRQIFKNPEILENPPESIVEDAD